MTCIHHNCSLLKDIVDFKYHLDKTSQIQKFMEYNLPNYTILDIVVQHKNPPIESVTLKHAPINIIYDIRLKMR